MSKVASYKIINDACGIRYCFFCELSGARVFETKTMKKPHSSEAFEKAWQIAKPEFNRCEKCGRFVCDTMYNADTLMCVDCSPWENPPKFCKHCGKAVERENIFCTNCGTALRYEEE